MQIGAKARFSTFRKNLNFYKENFGFINLIIIFASEGCTSPIYNIYRYMRRYFVKIVSIVASATAVLLSCAKIDDIPNLNKNNEKQKIGFDVLITRDGEVVDKARTGIMTKSSSDDLPFGLIGIDYQNGQLVLGNAAVSDNGSGYSGMFDKYLWSSSNKISFSAYYPHVDAVSYGSDLETYAIPYSVSETEAGPLVSKTVEKAINDLNMIPLMFQHITNDIGYKICDVTPVPELQGLIHLRKLTAYNVAQAGVFINDVVNNYGSWHKQAYYRRIVVFEGDALVGVGSENEKFVGYDTLEDHMAQSHRYYSIPDDIEIGKQNTFHIGLDLSSVYHKITFAPSVGDWETKIYENNDTF